MMAGQDKTMAAAKKLQKSYFDVLGLCCPSEIPLVENILKPLEGVKEVSVIVPTRTVIVVHDSLLISQIQIVKALNQARLEANVRAYGGEDNYKKKWPSPYAIASGVLLLLSLLKYFYHPLRWLALGAVAVGIFPIAMKCVAAVRNLRLDINILMIVAVIGTIVLKDYTEAGTIVFLFIIADWLESRAGHKAKAVMASLMSMAPQKAVLAENGEVVDVDEVKVSTILAVKAGEVIPIDGIVVEGKGEVDEKTLTGESYPVAKEKDSSVWAGTINVNGYLSVKTTALAEDCVVAKLAKLVEEAHNSKSSTQRFIDKCAKFYTPAVLVIFISIAVIPAVLHVHNYWSKWFHLALVVLVSACPCALILSTPVVTFCTLSKAATSGLLIKGGDNLETLAKVKIMAFDKTGTITRGEFVVMDFQSLRDDISLNTLIYWVASIESKSSHPMANALVDYGRSLSIEPKPENVEEFENFPGEGIHGKIDGQDIYIGNRKIASRASCETVPTIEGAKGGKTIGYIYSGGTPAGVFAISDACRSGVAEAVKELKKLGIKTAMLTGDSQAAALHTNEQLKQAIEVVHAELLPEDKARIIKELKTQGVVAMVGDGINDTPALATADIGISMGISGSALAQETGNIILLSNDIRKLPKAVKLAKRANKKVVENVALSITTKAGVLALGFAGHPLVWAAVLADVGTCLLVILNSMLILRGTDNKGRKCGKTSVPHNPKHGSHGDNQSQNDKNCCSGSKAREPQNKCSSLKCGSNPKHGSNGDSQSQKDKNCCSGSKAYEQKNECSSLKCGSNPKHGSNGDSQSQNDKNCCSVSKPCEPQNKCSSPKCGSNPKHGNNGDSQSQNDKNCCSGSKPCEPKSKCSSQKCGSNCQPSPLNSVFTSNQACTDELHVATHCDQASCAEVNHDLEAQNEHNHGCLGPHNWSSCAEDCCTTGLIEMHGDCAEGDELHEENHCTHSVVTTDHCHSVKCGKEQIREEGHGPHETKHCNHSSAASLEESRKLTSPEHCHSSHCDKEHIRREGDGLHEVKHCKDQAFSSEESGELRSTGHCHSSHSGKDLIRNEASGRLDSTSCDRHHQHHHVEEITPPHTIVEILPACDHEESAPTHSCISSGTRENEACCSRPVTIHACVLQKREVSGCCKSYMKECCRGHRHLGSSFRGSFSEISVEQI